MCVKVLATQKAIGHKADGHMLLQSSHSLVLLESYFPMHASHPFTRQTHAYTYRVYWQLLPFLV